MIHFNRHPSLQLQSDCAYSASRGLYAFAQLILFSSLRLSAATGQDHSNSEPSRCARSNSSPEFPGKAKDIKIHLDRSAVELLIDKGYDPTYGARPMRRAVEKYLEDPLAEEFLRGNIKQGDTLEVHAAGEQLAFKVTQPEQSEPANGSPLGRRG